MNIQAGAKTDLSRLCCWVAKHVEAIKKIIDEQKINPKIIGIIIGNYKNSETLDKKFALLLQYAPKLIELQYSNDQIAALIFKQSRYQKEVLDLLIKNTAWLSIENKFYTHEKLVEIALSSNHDINLFCKFIHYNYPRLDNETEKCSKITKIGASKHRAKKHPRLDAQIIEIDNHIPALSDNAFSDNAFNVSYANTHLAGRLFANHAANFQNHLITPDVLINEMISNIDDSVIFEEEKMRDLENINIPEISTNPISALDLQFDELFSVSENSYDEKHPDQVASRTHCSMFYNQSKTTENSFSSTDRRKNHEDEKVTSVKRFKSS